MAQGQAPVLDCAFEKADIFKKLVEGIKELNKEINIEAKADGLEIQTMDSSHVALISVKVARNAFSEYNCERELTMGVPMEYVSKVLKLCGSNDKLRLQGSDDTNSLTFISDSLGDSLSNFELKLMTIDADQLGIPEQEHSAQVTLPSSRFSQVVKDLGQFGDTLMVKITKEGVTFSISGETGNGSVTLKANTSDKEADAVSIKCTAATQNTFAIRYLNMFSKAAPIAPSVTLKMQPEMPLVVEFALERAENGHVKFYLAPKIDEN